MLTDNLGTMWMDSLSFSVRIVELNSLRGISAEFGKIKGGTAKPKQDFIKDLMCFEKN
jgi:hypothetical protein